MTIADINSKISFLTKTNTTSFPAADRLVEVNNAYERVASLILQSDGRWQWEDTNNSDLPIGTTGIVSGQQDYSLSTTHLRVLRIEVKNSSGNWSVLRPRDPADNVETAESTTNSGVPTEYDILGTSVFLYPTPNYTQTASLKIFFQRGPAVFTSAEVTTGTKVPGFNSLYHDLIPLWVAYNYAVANGLPTANGFMNEIVRREDQLQKDYGRRNKDDRPQITMKGLWGFR